MLNVVKLLDEVERFYQDFVKDVVEGDVLYAVAGFVYALLDREAIYGKVKLEEIDRKNNKIVFAIRFVRDGKEMFQRAGCQEVKGQHHRTKLV